MPDMTESELQLWLHKHGISNRVCVSNYNVDLSECGDIIMIPLRQFATADAQQQKT